MATDRPKPPARNAKTRAPRKISGPAAFAPSVEDHVPAVLAAPAEGQPAPVVTPAEAEIEASTQTVLPEDVIAVEALTPVPAIAADDAPANHIDINTHAKEEITMDATFNTAADTAHETVDAAASAASNTTDKAQVMFADVSDRAKSAMERSQRALEEMNEFSKGNVEALVESGKIAAKGIETMGQEAAEYSRRQFESITATMKSFASVKSPTEFFKLHSDYVRQSFDSIVAETSKNTESMLKLAGEVAQPLSTRVALAAEKIKIAA